MSLYFFPDGTKRNFKRSNEDSHVHPGQEAAYPRAAEGGGFPGFPPLSPAFTFLAGLCVRVTSQAEGCWNHSKHEAGGGAQGPGGVGGRDGPGPAGASLGSGSPRHVGPALRGPGRGMLQARGSGRGAGFPRLCKEVAAAATALLRRVGSGARRWPACAGPVARCRRTRCCSTCRPRCWASCARSWTAVTVRWAGAAWVSATRTCPSSTQGTQLTQRPLPLTSLPSLIPWALLY